MTSAPYDPDRVSPPIQTADIPYERAIEACQSAFASDTTNARLVFQLGRAFYAAKSFNKSIELFRRAAKEGYRVAEFALAVSFHSGNGAAQNIDTAKRLYRQAAQKGVRAASLNLAIIHLESYHTRDEGQGTLRRLSAEGYVPAQIKLGDLHLKGQHVQRDYVLARRFYRMAAIKGDSEAQRKLGHIHLSGQGVTPNDREAVRWFRASAEAGNPQAQLELGYMLAVGRGVIQDYVESYKWYTLGIARKDAGEERDRAVNTREELQRRMTPAHVAEAQRRARAWRPKP